MAVRRSIFLVFASVLVGGSASTGAAPNLAPPFYVAKADAYVSAASAGRNFGGGKVLEVRGTPASRAYIRFDLRGFSAYAAISKATLRLQSRSARGRLSVRTAPSTWDEHTISYRNAPKPGRIIASAVQARNGSLSINVTKGVSLGRVVTFALTAPRGVVRIASRESSRAPRLDLVLLPAATLIAAGDVGDCASTSKDEATAALVERVDGTVAALGDLAYEHGTLAEFNSCYHPSWGRFKSRTRPAIGNHEYETRNPSGYFTYWGSVAGDPTQGWYSYNLGSWHVVVLNSNCGYVGCSDAGRQVSWLRADLAAHRKTCTLAYWHHPLFSGGETPSYATVAPIWKALYAANADVVLNGHAHNYQRFGPQRPSGAPDRARGIREFVVGTGGHHELHSVARIANTEVADDNTWGVLELTLRPKGYEWVFHPIAGQTFTDSGSQACH